MWHNNWTSKALIIVVCFLVVGIAGCGNGVASQGGGATRVAQSHTYSTLATSKLSTHTLGMIKTNAAAFTVTSIDMSVTPSTLSLWKCGSYIQAVYNAVFHINPGSSGGTIVFSYTLNNGRSQTFEKLTVLPGQQQTNYTFTWQGSLPIDHTYPGPGGVFVTSPNSILSQMVYPAGRCS